MPAAEEGSGKGEAQQKPNPVPGCSIWAVEEETRPLGPSLGLLLACGAWPACPGGRHWASCLCCSYLQSGQEEPSLGIQASGKIATTLAFSPAAAGKRDWAKKPHHDCSPPTNTLRSGKGENIRMGTGNGWKPKSCLEPELRLQSPAVLLGRNGGGCWGWRCIQEMPVCVRACARGAPLSPQPGYGRGPPGTACHWELMHNGGASAASQPASRKGLSCFRAKC